MANHIWEIKDRTKLDVSTFKVMGILNVTPDSFYDGKKYIDFDSAIAHAMKMAQEGADIIDVGGESTRPGSPRISAEEEIKRVVPVISALSKNIGLPLSCDTYKAEVAVKAIEAGVSIINDISAFSMDSGLFDVVKYYGCGYVLMHMQGTPGNMQEHPFYKDVVGEVISFFHTHLKILKNKGLDINKIVVDPGIGFGKRLKDNLLLIRNLERFQKLGRPVLIGTSRKSFIGNLLNGLPAEERLEGSLASAVVAYMRAARIFRVHDVKETKRALLVAASIETEGYTEPHSKL